MRNTRLLILSVIITGTVAFGFCSLVFGQSTTPKFSTYNVKSIFKGKNASPKLTADDMQFRTRLRYAAKQKADFAGEYVLAAWGCGAECLMGAAVNVRTGNVFWLPHTICCWAFGDDVKPIDYRLSSRLVVFSGSRNESEKDSREDMHFYEFRNGLFRFIKTIKRSAKN